jgi:flagellar motor switch protein FliG
MYLTVRDPSTAPRRPFATLDSIHPRVLASIVEPEEPATVGAILLELEPSRAGRVIEALPEPLAVAACQALGAPDPAPGLDLERVERRLLDRWLGREAAAARHGGVEALTEVLAAVPHHRFERLLAALRDEAPELAVAARTRLVGFDDLARLDVRSLSAIVREVPHKDLVLALVGAPPELHAAVAACMSTRAAAVLEEDIGIAGLGRHPEGEAAAARLRVTWVAKRLAETGEIGLPGA